MVRSAMVSGTAKDSVAVRSAYILLPPLPLFLSRFNSFGLIVSSSVMTDIIVDFVSLLYTSLAFCTITTSTWLFTCHLIIHIVVFTMAPAAHSTAPATAPAVASEASKAKENPQGQ